MISPVMTQYKPSLVIVKGENKTDKIISYNKNGDRIDITYRDGSTYSYSEKNVKIIEASLQKCFEYLKEIAVAVGLKNEDGGNILASQFQNIDFISAVSAEGIFSSFLAGKPSLKSQLISMQEVYPFGFNSSQKDAVYRALSNQLSIIEGPPGTGKTQTILNIIANTVMNGESAAVVSSNNSATANVLEKLKKYGVDFIAASLGSSQNKNDFIQSQIPLPELSKWTLSLEHESEIRQSLKSMLQELNEMLAKKEALSKARQELDAVEVEYEFFMQYYKNTGVTDSTHKSWRKIDARTALELWFFCEQYTRMKSFFKFLHRIINRIKYGFSDGKFYTLPPQAMIATCQNHYYQTKIREYKDSVRQLETELKAYNFDEKMKAYSDLSMCIFRHKLSKKYENSYRKDNIYTLNALRTNPKQFLQDYPVILSTTYSLRSSLSNSVMYDYVIIDEASQVNLATGALALLCARKAVIVGDLKQLPNVVNSQIKKQTDAIFEKYTLPDMYRYSNHSLLLTLSEMFPEAPKTLLREHYRCHPKIIGFCNEKFYDDQLIILSEIQSNRQPLMIYKTAPGNHARDHVNQREIDVIKDEIIPQQGYDIQTASLGIVTPYRNQANALQSAFKGTNIKADTVDKFQGQENDIIILSTVDNTISDFTDNANRLNVAVSRAIEQLILVVNDNDDVRDTNIGDLIRYIMYNNGETIKSEIYSIFDYLYKCYTEERKELLNKYKRVSEWESENLAYGRIIEVLEDKQFVEYDVASHVQLANILRGTKGLNNKERQYAMNQWTHVDFLIFKKIGRIPVLAVEVDGMKYHKKGTRQDERDKLKNGILEKYGLSFIRFKTDGTEEARCGNEEVKYLIDTLCEAFRKPISRR